MSEMNSDNNSNELINTIDLKHIFLTLWDKKLFLTSITSIAALMSVLYALSLPNIYKSSALLAPTSKNDSMSSGIGELSGLANLAGINLDSGNISNSQIAIERIQTFEFFSKYFLPNIKLEDLMAVEKWNMKNNSFVYNQSLFDDTSKSWVRNTTYPKQKKPSAQEAFKEYKKILHIRQDKDTGLVTLTIKHKSPFVAKEWLDTIIYKINESIREIDTQDAQNSINFLNELSGTISIQSIKEVVARLMESQMQTLMLASSNEAYVFKIINSPIVPEEKSEPVRSFVCIVGTILGFFVSMLLVLLQKLRNSIKSN